MADHFYIGIYADETLAKVKAQELTTQGFKVDSPAAFDDGAVNYTDTAAAKTATTHYFGKSWLVKGSYSDAKADAPKADAPKADAPKADAAKADPPKADAPKAPDPAAKP